MHYRCVDGRGSQGTDAGCRQSGSAVESSAQPQRQRQPASLTRFTASLSTQAERKPPPVMSSDVDYDDNNDKRKSV